MSAETDAGLVVRGAARGTGSEANMLGLLEADIKRMVAAGIYLFHRVA